MAQDTSDPIIQYSLGTDLLEYGIGSASTITSIGTGTKVYLQSVTVSQEGESKSYKDNVGQTVALVIPEQYQTLQCEGLLIKGQSNSVFPKKGDEVQNIPDTPGLITSNVTFRLETFSTSWSNEDVTKVSMTIRGYKF